MKATEQMASGRLGEPHPAWCTLLTTAMFWRHIATEGSRAGTHTEASTSKAYLLDAENKLARQNNVYPDQSRSFDIYVNDQKIKAEGRKKVIYIKKLKEMSDDFSSMVAIAMVATPDLTRRRRNYKG
eukprot:3987751-Pleurochrysis_carterae.AAC.6